MLEHGNHALDGNKKQIAGSIQNVEKQDRLMLNLLPNQSIVNIEFFSFFSRNTRRNNNLY